MQVTNIHEYFAFRAVMIIERDSRRWLCNLATKSHKMAVYFSVNSAFRVLRFFLA